MAKEVVSSRSITLIHISVITDRPLISVLPCLTGGIYVERKEEPLPNRKENNLRIEIQRLAKSQQSVAEATAQLDPGTSTLRDCRQELSRFLQPQQIYPLNPSCDSLVCKPGPSYRATFAAVCVSLCPCVCKCTRACVSAWVRE